MYSPQVPLQLYSQGPLYNCILHRPLYNCTLKDPYIVVFSTDPYITVLHRPLYNCTLHRSLPFDLFGPMRTLASSNVCARRKVINVMCYAFSNSGAQI